jgi:hypothetical protein
MLSQEETKRKEGYFYLTEKVLKTLREIDALNKKDHKENSKNGRMDFAYAEYYIEELVQLLNFSIYVLEHNEFRKYIHFPIRLIMEILLQMEHVYSVKKKKGLKGVQRLMFKDITSSSKRALALPGDKGGGKIKTYLRLLNFASRILKLDFLTDHVSELSDTNIKSLCEKSTLVIKKTTGADLHHFYSALSESSHANFATIGASNVGDINGQAFETYEIGIELAIRFCEMVITESKYTKLDEDIKELKRLAGI